MDPGRCRRCGRAFSAGEVAGLGILRPRSEREGGPFVEFACPSCKALHRLIPYGDARYAWPGEPPPPPPPAHERRLPWQDETRKAPPRASAPPPPEAPAPAPSASAAGTPPPSQKAPPATAPPRPPTPWEILGVSPTASREEIDSAYRQRALQCHPDKVAHLDPEFRVLAERKFRELLAAYEALAGEPEASRRRAAAE